MAIRNTYLSLKYIESKETTLERADFTLQLLMFVTEEKGKEIFIVFFLSTFCQLLFPQFQTRKG